MTKVRYTGSANQKLVAVNKNLGVKGMAGQQATTRIIYDAVKLATTTVNTTITLFQNCKTRQFPLTNLSENKLQVAESIALQRFSVYIIQCTTGTTDVQDVSPLGYFPQFRRLYASTLDFNIAQNQVIKQMPLASMYAPFNHKSKFMGYFQTQSLATDPLTSYLLPQDIFEFDTNTIIPPQIEFYAQFTVPPIALPSGSDFYLAMKLEGLGSLLAPKANF